MLFNTLMEDGMNEFFGLAAIGRSDPSAWRQHLDFWVQNVLGRSDSPILYIKAEESDVLFFPVIFVAVWVRRASAAFNCADNDCFQQSLSNNGKCDQRCPQHCLTVSADSESLQWNMTSLWLTGDRHRKRSAGFVPATSVTPCQSAAVDASYSEHHCCMLRCLIIQWRFKRGSRDTYCKTIYL